MMERVALFGDAAGICKPTTGGGIGPGFKQVDMLVPLLSKSIIDNDLSNVKMQKLSGTLKEMKRDQRKKRALRDAFLTEMDDSELERIFSVWARPEVTQLINEFGDIENPIPLGIKMLREVPEFRRLAGRAAKAVLWGK
jgi:flavin-dependent dehydrogenase